MASYETTSRSGSRRAPRLGRCLSATAAVAALAIAAAGCSSTATAARAQVYSLTEIANNLKGVLPQSPTPGINPENWYFVK